MRPELLLIVRELVRIVTGEDAPMDEELESTLRRLERYPALPFAELR